MSMVGCSPTNALPVKVVPASGTVTYKGQPVASAQLTFHAASPSESAFALTDARGKFQCMTNDSSTGIVPGKYIVSISKPKGGIPSKYADAKSALLSVSVKEGAENQFDLELKD